MSKLLKISGNTYPHRETIKSLGGKFDGVTRMWTLPDTESNRELIANWTGVTMLDSIEEYKPTTTPTPNQSRFTRAFGGSAPSAAVPPAKPVERSVSLAPAKKIGNVAVYGESEQYLHYFQDALAFAGFDSLEALANYIEKLPRHVTMRGPAWDIDTEAFRGTRTMSDAIRLTRNGWQDGIDMAKKVAERIAGQMPTRRQRVHSVAGGSVNVGRMLSGNPLHMRQRVKLPSSKVITLVNNTGFQASITPEAISIRAAIVAAMADTLENAGYACEIVSVSKANFKVLPADEIPGAPFVVTATKIKSAGDRLNLSDVMFGLGHTSMHRRFQFAVRNTFDEFERSWMTYGASIGFEIDEPNTFVIGNLPSGFQIKGLTFDDKVSKIIKQIVPENLPLEFKFNA